MQTYDYIVVGSGSAGAVVAGRLSEDPGASVLVLEAGGKSRRNMNVQIPAAFAKQFKTEVDWEYYSDPEPYLNGRRVYQPRGKMLGGCSSMNAMIYIRGNRADYDGWAKAGATGWSYDEVLPLFRRSENNSRGASEFHGGTGPQYVEDPVDPRSGSRSIVEAMVEAMVETGIARIDDFNGAEQEGAGLYQRFTHNAQRWTTWDAFLAPHRKRPNLTVTTGAVAHRVVVENGTATGVVVDNPHVGSHLMDHPMYMMNWDTSDPDNLADAEKPAPLLRYLLRRKGMLTSNIGEAGAFFRTSVEDIAPQMQMIGAPVYFQDHGQAEHDGMALAIGLSLVGARSEGTVRLASSDAAAPPRICNNYFDDPRDMDSMVDGIDRAREIARSAALRGSINHEIHPGHRYGEGRKELEEAVRADVQHTYHPSCTARMGTEDDAVLDASLRVYGVQGLRVADASAMPRVTHGNTHAPTILIGEEAAVRDVGNLPRPPPGRRPVRSRCRPQRAAAVRGRAHRGAWPVPPLPAVGPPRRVLPHAPAAVVRQQLDGRHDRQAPGGLLGRSRLAQAPRRLRLRPARLTASVSRLAGARTSTSGSGGFEARSLRRRETYPNGSGSGASDTARARAAVMPRRWCWRHSTS